MEIFVAVVWGKGSVPLHGVADWVAYIAGTVSSN
jgi:hypothetical protein